MKDDPVGGGTTFIKMTRPEIGCIVRREALFARLDGLPGRIAAWIAGPPGIDIVRRYELLKLCFYNWIHALALFRVSYLPCGAVARLS